MDAVKSFQHERSDNCETHGKFTATGITIGSGPSARVLWHGCPTCSAENAEREEAGRKAIEERARQARLESALDYAGIPARFRERTFDNYEATTDEQLHALAVARDFADQFADHKRRGTSMVFSGTIGTGKSHLAIAIAKQVMQSDTAMYMSAIDAVRMVRDTWNRNSPKSETEVINTLGRIGLLILDEIGVQYGTEAEQNTLFDILNRRYADMRPTILLTNLGATKMEEYLGQRSFDRLHEGGIWVQFKWNSHRKQQKQI